MPGVGIGATVNLDKLTVKDFDKFYYDSYLRPDPEYTKIFNVNTGKANYYRAAVVTGFGALQDMSEGQAIPYEVIKQGNEKTIRYTNIGLACAITRNMREDDISGVIVKIPGMMGEAMAYTCELKAWDVLNTGFVTTYRTAMQDSKALFSATHTLVDSGTAYSNLGTAGSLSETTLQALMDCLESNVTEKNIPAPIKPVTLIVPVALRWVAERLMLTELKVGSMDNDINTIKGKLNFMVGHYLTSTTAYFVAADKANHDLQFIWKRKQTTQAQDDFGTDSWLYKVTARLTADFFDYRGVAGNAGA
jgi:phage major head subunit gpT-like protein